MGRSRCTTPLVSQHILHKGRQAPAGRRCSHSSTCICCRADIILGERTELQTGILLQGLPLLHKLLFEMTDHEHLVTTVQSHLCRAYLDFEDLTGLYNEIYHEERRENHSDERDRKQDVRDPLPFLEDRIDAPPFSWTMMWKGTYSNLYGWYIPDDMRPWGYIFWDAGRLERVDAINLIQDRWEVLHLHDDPRDHYPWSDY